MANCCRYCLGNYSPRTVSFNNLESSCILDGELFAYNLLTVHYCFFFDWC